MSKKDKEILRMMREAREREFDSVSLDTIAYVVGMPKRDVSERLRQLEKDGTVRARTERKSKYWGIFD